MLLSVCRAPYQPNLLAMITAAGALLWGAPALAQEVDQPEKSALPTLGLDWESRDLHLIWPSFGLARGPVFRPDAEVSFGFRLDGQVGVEKKLELSSCVRICSLGLLVRTGAIFSGPSDERTQLTRLDVATPVSFEINDGGESYVRFSAGPDFFYSIPDKRVRVRQDTQSFGVQAEVAAGFLPYQTLETFISVSAFTDDLGPARDFMIGMRFGPSVPGIFLYGLLAEPIRAARYGNEKSPN